MSVSVKNMERNERMVRKLNGIEDKGITEAWEDWEFGVHSSLEYLILKGFFF